MYLLSRVWEMVLILKNIKNRVMVINASIDAVLTIRLVQPIKNDATKIPIKNAMLIGNNGFFIYFHYLLYLIFCQLIIDIY